MMHSPHTWLLAIDTSTEMVGLAVTDGAVWRRRQWIGGRHQTAQVMGEIERILDSEHIGRADLAAVAVATGPGMFSGLRVGLAIAKGLHLGLGLPVIGVSTIEITIEPFLKS